MKNNKTKNKVIITFMTMMMALSLISCTKNASEDNAKNDSPEEEVYEEQMADSKREEAVLKKEKEKTEGVTDSKKDEQDNIYLFSSDNDLSDEEKELYYGEGNLIDRINNYLGGWNSFRSQYISFFDMQDQYWSNDTTINNEFKILKYLYDNKDQYSHLIETMKNTSFLDRIDKYIPQDIVAHKIGDLDTAANDEAIVFTDKPYIIILLTDNVGYSYETIADISKAAYIYNLTN